MFIRRGFLRAPIYFYCIFFIIIIFIEVIKIKHENTKMHSHPFYIFMSIIVLIIIMKKSVKK